MSLLPLSEISGHPCNLANENFQPLKCHVSMWFQIIKHFDQFSSGTLHCINASTKLPVSLVGNYVAWTVSVLSYVVPRVPDRDLSGNLFFCD